MISSCSRRRASCSVKTLLLFLNFLVECLDGGHGDAILIDFRILATDIEFVIRRVEHYS